MKGAFLVASLLLSGLVAGCGSPSPGGKADVKLDTIVPGAWHVSATTDYIMVWAHNEGLSGTSGTWSLTGPGGAALPAGWTASFDPPAANLGINKSPMNPSTREYADWTSSLATLNVPAAAAGDFDLELRFGDAVRGVKAGVDAAKTQVSQKGMQVDITYAGRFQDTGAAFDDGEFPLELGSTRAIKGFSYGTIGLAAGEQVVLSVPPAYGYGFDDPGHAQFLGRTLDFTVSIATLPAPPTPPPPPPPLLHPDCVAYNDVPDPNAPYPAEAQDKVKVRIETTLGNLTVETDAEHAPLTVANFLQYVDDGFYACTTFHRIAPGFVVQAGGYLSDHSTHKPTRDPVPLEATAEEPNVKWSLSMARIGPDTATSEFFVNLGDNTNLDPTGPKTGYAVFAHLVDGEDAIDAMLGVPRGKAFSAGGYYPAQPIVILRAYRIA